MNRSFAIHKISGKFALQCLLILAILDIMNTDTNKEIRVGIVALTSLILLVAGITIGKGLLVGVSQKTVPLQIFLFWWNRYWIASIYQWS